MISRTPARLFSKPLFGFPTRHGFTLIELLVVISIIAILASLAFPAVNGALDSARKARAKNDVVQIATAVVAYETEYGRLPTNASGTIPVNNNFLSILTGAETNGNPRRIVFLEVSPWKKGQGGINTNGAFCDPWENTSVYQIALDTDYDNKVNAGKPSANIMKKVAVWNEPATQTNRRYVTSW
jgi:prepilin-type N-terminal cleavage/methylation domain-containing protein